RGKTLNALQYLTQLVLNKDAESYQSVTVDAEGYRKRRKDTPVELSHKMRDKALRLNRKVALEPMPAYERKIIHSALQEMADVATYSDGKEPHRYIVIKPAKYKYMTYIYLLRIQKCIVSNVRKLFEWFFIKIKKRKRNL